MEQSKRDVLTAHRVVIADNLQERRVIEQLFAEGVLDQTDREEIHAETSRFGKCCLLLDKLPGKGPNAFDRFLQALRLSGQGFLADKLTGESSTGANLSPSRSFGLPNKVPKFVGRSDVCEEISGLLTSPETTLVSLIAPPGFGKTAIAITVGHEMLEKGKDVLYVSLRRVDSADGAAKRLLEVIGIPVDKDPVAQVKSFLSSLKKETMLVLDNAEDLQNADKPACNQFLEVVGEHGKNLVILITSRNPLSLFDFPFKKHRIPLKPLDDEASFFFLKHYAPNISDQLARHFAKPKVCGGVPLFLKLIVSFLESKTIDPIDLHRKLKNCPHGFLKEKDPIIQGFFSVFKVFYDLLHPEVKKGLSWLAAFPSVFTKMEAKNVLFCKQDYLDFQILLNSLVSHSVVQEEEVDNHQQYSLHPLVQAFCIACREDECKGYNMAIRLFSCHYLSLLRQLNDDFFTTDCKVAIDKYQTNKANIAHALSASTEDEILKCYGINVSTETVNFLAKVMNQDEFISTYDKFLEVAETLPDKTLYSECLVSIGFKQLCYYSYKDAHRTTAKMNLQKAHDLQIDLGIYDTECQGHCKCKLGLCTFLAGERKKGISLIAQGIGVRRKLVRSNHSGKMERVLLAGGFYDLGMALFASGQLKAALNIWENICLVKYRELLGTHPFTASLLAYIAKVYQALGKPRQAMALKKESLRMSRFLLGLQVPSEINARGPRAKLAYENALKTGKVKVYRARIMLIGQDRAGKTSLKKSFLSLPFDPGEESTDGIEVESSKFEVDIDQVKNWKRTDEKWVMSQFVPDLAKMVAEKLKENTDDEEGGVEEINDVDNEFEKEDDVNLVQFGFDDPRELQEQETNVESLMEETPALFNSQLNQGTSSKADEKETNTAVPTDLKIDPGLPPEEFMDHLTQYLKSLNLQSNTTPVERHMTLDLWDFAGQHLYYASYPVFLSTRAVYMLVYNLSKGLKETAQPRFRQGVHESLLDNPNNENNLENLLSWLVSVSSVCSLEPDVSERTAKLEDLPYVRPPVFIVGTHADEPYQDGIKEMELQIKKEISGKDYESHVIRPFFSVNNRQGSSDEGVVALQKRMIEVLKQEPYIGEELPIRWLNFEKVVEALIAKKVHYLNLEQLQSIIQKVCFIEDEDEIDTLLNFYHDLGAIVRHRNTVILRAQWLIEVFKQLITIRSFDEMEPRHSKFWKEMETTGALDMELVDHVFSKYCQQGLIKEDILNMMDQFGLIVKYITSPTNEMYFVPCQLRTPPEALCKIKLSKSDPCPFYLHFLGNFVPHGFFWQLVSRITKWCCKGGFTQPPRFFLSASRFFIQKKSIHHQLTLLCKKRFIKIVLTHSELVCEASFSEARELAILVRTFLEETVQDLRRELPWLGNLKWDFCVACPGCLRKEEMCSYHNVVSCDHQDCLCLLKVLKEGQPSYCPSSLDGKVPTVLGLEKWFAVKDSQSTASSDGAKKRKGDLSTETKSRKTDSNPPVVDVAVLTNKELPKTSKRLDLEQLPIDILLLTVKDCEFLACLSRLTGFSRMFQKELGDVYIGNIGEMKIAVMKCRMGAAGPGSAAVVVRDAVKALTPKAVFCVGYCGGLQPVKVKLGDVVISEVLITYAPSKVTKDGIEERGDRVPLKPNLAKVILNAAAGWSAPLLDPAELEVAQIRGALLSGPQVVDDSDLREALLNRFPGAIAIESEGEGVYSAAHDLNVEWIIIKGVSDFADGKNSEKNEWRPFASIMAASFVAHILSNTIIFEDWPHYNNGKTSLPPS